MPGHRKRRQFKQTDAFTRGMVIGLKRAGWSIRQIAADTHLGASMVHRLWRRWLEQGNVAINRNVGATRVTSACVDRRILRQAVAAGPTSHLTISRRLVANGLPSCRPLRRLPLTPPNRRQRLEWCRARSTWMTEWHRVVFSDESRFCLSSDSRRVRVWRRRGERSNPAAILERPTVRQRGIMGTMTAQRYVDDVLRPVTLPYLQGVPNALYQQDNARPHTARISQQALQDVQMLPWPPYSPDLSPIEHIWDIIGRRLHALPQPRSEDELWQMVEREWRAIPQDAIRTLIDSLPRRVAACIAVRDDILLSCKIASDQLENYDKVIECFESHFIPRRNIIYERARFNQRCQQEGEKVNEFITALHSLAEHCNFGMLHDELIRDRIVVGVRDRALSERMQLDTDLTLVKATLMAKQLESVKEQQSSLYQQDSVDQIKKMPNHIKETKRHEPKIRQFKSNQLGGSSHGCTRCGNSNNHDWKNCPIMNSYCSKCKKKGHYAKVCRSEAINEIKSEIAFLGSVEDNSKKWIVPIKQLSSGSRGGQRGRLGSGDNRGCYNCWEEGHRKFECTKPARGGGRGRGQSRDGGSNNTCYNCGEVGHRKYECTNNTAEDGGQEENQRKSKKACYTCGEFGHKKDDCPKSGTQESGDEEESSDNEEEETPQKRKQAEDSEEEEVEAEEPPKEKSKKPKSKKKEEDCYLTLQAYRTMPLESARSREMRRPPLRHQPGSQGDARMTRSKRQRRIALHQRPHLQEMEGCRGTTKTGSREEPPFNASRAYKIWKGSQDTSKVPVKLREEMCRVLGS
ncbi:hypothetical protein LAZ67_9002778 [Cordylochernes scorpioides]|uniref:CCHC-type domain-containing protein n=1 Tax=Cordylochernes scorpioides TaxID=51811 RepID=A0ABY6KZ12_9ARAC|nr:hypothetical protein LAZ67_9002778 [Cordylochernes scorpioides]